MIVVLTTPQRPQFLAATLRALDAEGAAGKKRLLCVDGSVQDVLRARVVPRGWEVVSVGAGGTNTQVPFHGMCSVVSQLNGDEDVLYFEDDVRPCKNAVTGLGLLEVPSDCGFLAAFDHRNVMTSTWPRLLRIAADDPSGPQRSWGYWGNQALKIPMRTIAHLAKQRSDLKYGSGPRNRLWGCDVWLGDHAASSSAPWKCYAMIAPSLFQHVGAVSAVGTHWKLNHRVQGNRTAVNFRADFDALELAELLPLSAYWVNEFGAARTGGRSLVAQLASSGTVAAAAPAPTVAVVGDPAREEPPGT